ncbi:hypothetical protein [Aquitalea sp.]|uniref:hypothetical protein n=1 Tax=Aquitalea sp. TaxID=1872623 RepID=UPI00258A2A90|nr:hypothetical protein [Aquitalea sp.]
MTDIQDVMTFENDLGGVSLCVEIAPNGTYCSRYSLSKYIFVLLNIFKECFVRLKDFVSIVVIASMLVGCASANLTGFLGSFRHAGSGQYTDTDQAIPFISMLFDNGGVVNIDVGELPFVYAKLNQDGELESVRPLEGGVRLDDGQLLQGYHSDSYVIRRSYSKTDSQGPVVMPDKPDALAAWLSPDMPPAILFLYQQDQSGGIKLENAAQFLSGGANMASHHMQALLAVETAIYELVPGSDYRRFLQQMATRSKRCDNKGDERSLATVPCLPNHQLPVIFAIKAKRVVHLSQEMLNHAFGGKADLPLIPIDASKTSLGIDANRQRITALFTHYEDAHEQDLRLQWRCDLDHHCYPSGIAADNDETLVYAVFATSAMRFARYLDAKVPFTLPSSSALLTSPAPATSVAGQQRRGMIHSKA